MVFGNVYLKRNFEKILFKETNVSVIFILGHKLNVSILNDAFY